MSQRDKFLFIQSDLPLVSFRTFQDMRSQGELCDVTFSVDNLEVVAHRLILAANIPYFRAMFSSNMAETNQGIIHFQGIKPDTFVSLIHFAYGCEIEVNLDNVMSLLAGASYLQMDGVCDTCCGFLSEKMNLDNVLDLRELANAHGLLKLKQSTHDFLQSHFTEMSNKDEFLDLPFSYFKELISEDKLCVASEEVVFQVAMSWVKKSVEERVDRLPELLTSVRMPLLSYRYLSSQVASEELIQRSNRCQNLLEEAKDHRLLREKTSPCSFVTKQRQGLPKGQDSENCLYAVCRKEEGFPCAFVERFDLKVKRWTAMEAKTMYVEDSTVAIIGRKVYVIGGCDSRGRILDIVQVFDTESDSWGTAAVLKVPKRFIAAAVLDNKLYAFGGETVESTINSAEYYCSCKNEWSTLPSMLQYRSGACAVPCGMHIYVMGGSGGEFVTSNNKLISVERYNPETMQWSLVSEMKFTPYRCGVTTLGDKIYAHSEECLEVYDPWAKTWDAIPTGQNKKIGFSCLSLSEKLYVIGEDGRMCIYDPKIGEWSDAVRIPEKVHIIGTIAICKS